MNSYRFFDRIALALVALLLFCSYLHATEVEETMPAPAGATVSTTTEKSQTKATLSDDDAMDPVQIAALEEAENVDLSEPVVPESLLEKVSEATPIEPENTEKNADSENTDPSPIATPTPDEASDKLQTLADGDTATPAPELPFLLLQKKIAKGTTARLSWSPDQSFEGIATPTPVLVAHGTKVGPKLCLTAAVHGDELNGIEIVRRIMYQIDPTKLTGTVIGVPIVNLQGFRRGSRYLTDRRDLNRYFPGNPHGSSASRIAYSFFENVVRNCDFLVDLHTGSFFRTNLPQLRANLKDERVKEMTKAFDAIAVLHSEGAIGTLRRAAVDFGIPAVTLEAGGPMELDHDYVSQGTAAINTLLDKMGMLDTLKFWGTPQPTYYGSLWVRVDQGGILFSDVKLGARVREGDLLGTVTDPITNIKKLVISPVKGRVIGMAVNQVVLPGFAAFHIGINAGKRESSVENAIEEYSLPAQDDDEEEESSFEEFD